MQEKEVCEYQAWQQKLVFLFQEQIVSVIYVNPLEQRTWLKYFVRVKILQNWQPVKMRNMFQLHIKQ